MNKSNNKRGVIIMSMKKDQIGYDLNEQDIDAVIRFLKVHDPDNATPEVAIDFLASTKLNLRKNAGEDFSDNIIALYNEYKKSL